MIVKERLIILSKVKYGESDLILKVLSAEGDAYSVIAKSALKSRKRFGGGILEPTHYILGTLMKKSQSDESNRMSILNEAQIIDDFKGVKVDYDRLNLALHFVKTVGIVAREGDIHRETFNLLGHALKMAEQTEQLSQLKLRFDLKLLHLSGVLPPEPRFLPYLRQPIRQDMQAPISSDQHHLATEVESLFSNYLY